MSFAFKAVQVSMVLPDVTLNVRQSNMLIRKWFCETNVLACTAISTIPVFSAIQSGMLYMLLCIRN